MRVTKKRSEFGFDINLEEDDKYVAFSFNGNYDLYWTFVSYSEFDEEIDYTFTITMENFDIYKLFQELFDDIKNINLYDFEDDLFFGSAEKKAEYLKMRNKELEEEKIKYRKCNYSHYNELYDEENNTITWYSDETSWKLSNILKIKKEENTFKLEFYTQPSIPGYEDDFHYIGYIPIRFRNSGSSYEPFNNIFMKMYNKMSLIDDEECLFEQEKTRKLSKNS